MREGSLRDAAAPPDRRLALRIAAATPERRRVAFAVLAEGAAVAGGRVEERPGELVLVGAEPGRARRLRDLLERLLGGAELGPWPAALPSIPMAMPPAPDPPADLAALDPWLAALDPVLVARRRRGWRLGPRGPQPAFLRLDVAEALLAPLMGASGRDADLLAHARMRMQERLLAALAEAPRRRVLLGQGAVRQLHMALPAGGPLPAGLVLTVPLEAAADPEALAARRVSLATGGCRLELDGLDAAALPLLHAAALPADLLRLHWSPALAGMAEALAGVDPARLVLAGADSSDALAWAAAQGIALVESEAPVAA